jgi:hypothetical protein
MDFQALVGVMMNQIFPPRHIGSCDKIAPIGLVLERWLPKFSAQRSCIDK